LTKKLTTDAAYVLGEEAFRAGFKAGWGSAKAERIYSEEEEEDSSWGYYEPSEDVKALIDG